MRRFSLLILILTAGGFLIGTAIFTSVTDRTADFEDRTFVAEDRTEQEVIQAVIEVQDLSYDVSVPEGSTAYDLMVAVSQRRQYDDFSFKGKEFSGLGFFVEEINGLSQDQKEGMYWIYYINGEAAPVGISQYKVKDNDVITWKYEKEH